MRFPVGYCFNRRIIPCRVANADANAGCADVVDGNSDDNDDDDDDDER